MDQRDAFIIKIVSPYSCTQDQPVLGTDQAVPLLHRPERDGPTDPERDYLPQRYQGASLRRETGQRHHQLPSDHEEVRGNHQASHPVADLWLPDVPVAIALR